MSLRAKLPGTDSQSGKLSKRWSFFLIRSCYYAVAINFFFLVQAWALFYRDPPVITPRFFWTYYLILPTIAMLLITLFADRLVRSRRFSLKTSEYAAIFTLLVFSFLLSLLHNTTAGILVLFSVPVLISAVYSDIRLTRRVFYAAVILLVYSSYNMRVFSTRAYGEWLVVEAYTALGILVVSFLLSHVLIQFGEESVSVHNDKISLESQMLLDPLTDLYNRRAYNQFIPHAFDNARFLKSPLCLAEFDIDDFKHINDTYGHAAGDRVLLTFSELIRNLVPANVFAFRYGGEEFVLAFEGFQIQDAQPVCEQVLEAIRGVRLAETAYQPMTASGGLASVNEGMTAPEDLFNAADEALYQAKSTGKNRLMVLGDGAAKPAESPVKG